MQHQIEGLVNPVDLRARALARLSAPGGGRTLHASASEALRVLFELSSSADTAGDALALLHELQVHQVELDMQHEALCDARAEADAELQRRAALYEHSPAACLTVDASGALLEINRAGARLLGDAPEALLGRPLEGFFAGNSVDMLHTLLARARSGCLNETCTLELVRPPRGGHVVQASAAADGPGGACLLAFIDTGP